MRIAIVGPSGSGKTRLAGRVAAAAGLRHAELDGPHHRPHWESCGADVLRERVDAATQGDGWVADGTYHQMIGELVFERAQTVAWLDLPAAHVMSRLLRRTHVRKRDRVELWNGNLEPGWRESVPYLIWPAFKRVFENRRKLPARLARHPHLDVRRLRSDADVDAFVAAVTSD